MIYSTTKKLKGSAGGSDAISITDNDTSSYFRNNGNQAYCEVHLDDPGQVSYSAE